ncbi:CBS domain-containing protein [Lysobacter soli]|uniref:CBS domain-containing protein n=1 Tax=Lysobacter soli TaxID=453783 RepID=UPI0037C899B3
MLGIRPPEDSTMRIGDICTSDVACISPRATVQEAAAAMQRGHVGALVVIVDPERRPIGVVTDRDIVLKVVAKGMNAQAMSVANVMSTGIVTCKETHEIFDAIERMKENGIRRLPVTREDGKLVGVVAADDILRAVTSQLHGLSDAMLQEQMREMRLAAGMDA